MAPVSLVTVTMVTLCLYCDMTTGLSTSEAAQFTVSGSYSATLTVSSTSTTYTISSSGMPDHAWQSVNPNTPTAQNHVVTVPKTPTVASTKGCLPMGQIAITRTGVSLYNPLASGYVNAVEGSSAETFDSCDGHATDRGDYHYHKLPSSCLWQNELDYLIGVAMDGYPIYGPNTTGYSAWLTTSSLDDCHGITIGGEYRYVATTDFPYLLGCFHGVISDSSFDTTYSCSSSTNYAQWNGYLCSCHELSNAANSLTSLSQIVTLVGLVAMSTAPSQQFL
ncbi:uncharacterized protein LOC110466803 [Mizuhopecten yessoensis]|uniref:YHYH domain-containing protein n=1 Tax=Mizuhopecten yessoensis TaxID=6573 RepID=A0A210R1X5_MIZYE|nr:uncharacterized protein LOC110466803 [Mizuhopecten yessoensis]OWF54891.1 hypothetical protein KP79_PYT23827 [Mizuhopecten yessoensis]